MNASHSVIGVRTTVTNPGQFFACCGLFEIANTLWPGTQGWFDHDMFLLDIPCNSGDTSRHLLDKVVFSTIDSSLTDYQTQRLKTLKNLAKKKRTREMELESSKLNDLWERETIHLHIGSGIYANWWSDSLTGGADLKTWAGKQFAIDIIRRLQAVLREMTDEFTHFDRLLQVGKITNSLPLYFDSGIGSCSSSRDVGFSLDSLDMNCQIKPMTEFLAFWGLQRFRPLCIEKKKRYRYATWSDPQPIVVAQYLCTSLWKPRAVHDYEFGLFYRSQYLKSFLSAVPVSQGVVR
jgi:CRISPR-associated protein Csb3